MGKVADFSKEIGIKSSIPTYAGGMGILVGDTAKSAADLGLDWTVVTLSNTNFEQRLDGDGRQLEHDKIWNPSFECKKLLETVDIEVEKRKVRVGAWECDIVGRSKHIVPVYFLDTDFEVNNPKDRKITSILYPSDPELKFLQSMVLSIGGLYFLRELGEKLYDIDIYHMNESSPALLTSELFKEFDKDIIKTKEKCVFTSHTPLPHGNESFEYSLVRRYMNHQLPCDIEQLAEYYGKFSLMKLAASLSGYRNTVSRKTAEILNRNFEYLFDYINNGVHPYTWTAKEFQELYDEHIPEWRNDPTELKKAILIDKEKIWNAHQSTKKRTIDYINDRYERIGVKFDPDELTIGIARRATLYKRIDLILSDIERLLKIGRGKLQLIFAGKSHPNETEGKEMICRTVQITQYLTENGIPSVYDVDYNMDTAALFVSGVDLWLNTSRKFQEASGTSGMKAALNGVPQFSTLDGWWIDGCTEGVTGWAIGDLTTDDKEDRESLYKKLEETIIPLYNNRSSWLDVMVGAITHNASYYHTHRVLKEYGEKARIPALVRR